MLLKIFLYLENSKNLYFEIPILKNIHECTVSGFSVFGNTNPINVTESKSENLNKKRSINIHFSHTIFFFLLFMKS